MIVVSFERKSWLSTGKMVCVLIDNYQTLSQLSFDWLYEPLL